jgi:Concanavalin A-like lectin/glucanases superfamily/Bacterial Ig domain
MDMKCDGLQGVCSSRLLRLCTALWVSLAMSAPAAAQAPGGFVENVANMALRPRLTQSQIQGFLPDRGKFTFPAPYNTTAARITNASDCGGADCVWYVGYSYWRNINNHVGSDTMLIFLGLDSSRGGGGPTLFQYNKMTDVLTKVGPLFAAGSPLSFATAEGWYFSATLPTKLYLNQGARMLRYDVVSKQFETVYDASTQFGSDKVIWQMHSSNDDRVHSATLRSASTFEMLGCMVYREDTRQFFFYPKIGDFDECQVDKSGRWLLIKDNVDGIAGEDNRIIDLETGSERLLLDQAGAAGHSDMGYGYMVAADNWDGHANASKLWKYADDPLHGALVHYNFDWSVAAPNHFSHSNAQPGVAPEQQYVCGSSANRLDSPEANEIICFRLDGSLDTVVVAPVMTDLNAAGGGNDYAKLPKGNLDVTGQYFIWTSNTGGNRLDAFLVKVPAQLLTGVADAVAPTVAIASPPAGSTVSGVISISANAADNVGVAAVQFQLDGVNLGAAVTAAPYAISWNPATVAAGAHSLAAVARDAAGNSATSSPVVVTTLGDITPPVISRVAAGLVTSSTATIVWTTDELSDSFVEYGVTSIYGSRAPMDPVPLVSHAESLSALSPNTLYHYRVSSRDAAGNLAVSGDFTLTTLASVVSVPSIPDPIVAPPPDPVAPAPASSPATAPAAPVGYWKFDEGSGTTAADASGDGNTGTLMNGPAWIPGRLGQALAFDGVDDSVQIAAAPGLNSYPLTVAFWMRTGDITGVHGLVNKYFPSSLNGYQVFLNNGSVCAWYFKDAANYVWDGSGCTLSVPGYADSQWHHVAFVVDAAGGRLYVDGAQKAAQPWTGIPGSTSTPQGLSLGQYPGTARPYFSGALDDVRIYAQALGAADVAALSVAPPPGPVGYWKLDESSGTTAADASGGGNTGTLVNGPAWVPGKLGQALAFDGVNDSVQIPHADALNAYPLTVAFWMKTGNIAGLHGIVNKYFPGSLNGYQVFMSNGNLCAWYFRDGSDYVWDGSACTLSVPGYADDQWHHVAFVVDPAGARLYVDGVQKASQRWTGVAGRASTLQGLSFGQYPGTAQPYFSGALDDVRTYSRALTAAELTAIFNAPNRQNVVWTNLVNVTATSNALQKTAGCDGCDDAGAVSQQQIGSGGGYIELTASEIDKLRYAGLTGSNAVIGATGIAFALRFQAGVAEVRENGVYRADIPFVSGDVFRISVVSGVVKYSKNGTVFYTSASVPTYPLVADTAFFNLGATIADAAIATIP